MQVSPVVLFLFNRPNHTKRTLESLARNTLAKLTPLYIYIDGPRDVDDVENILKVSDLAESFKRNRFLSVNIVRQSNNIGLGNSVIQGVSEVVEKYGRVIVLEDDLITSPYFLEYMNQALDFYKNHEKIWSISGYSPKLKATDYISLSSDVYLFPRGSSWGWATWKNKWDMSIWEVEELPKFNLSNHFLLRKAGVDMAYMLEMQRQNVIDSWAVRWVSSQIILGMYTVYPIVSLVENIGMDGSGVHGQSNDARTFGTSIVDTDLDGFLFTETVNKRVNGEFAKLYGSSIHGALFFIKYFVRKTVIIVRRYLDV